MNFKIKAISLASTLTFISASVSAAGFQIFQQNASGLGNSYAGSAAIADNASTVFFNPAGMTELRGTHLSTGISVTDASVKFTNNGSNTTSLTGAGNGGDAGTTALIPNLFLTHELNEKMYIGLGISAPFGSHSKYDDPWLGGAQSLEFRIKTININPSIAYKLNELASVGVGLNYQQMDARYKKIAGPYSGSVDLLTPAGPDGTINLLTGRTVLNAEDSSFGWNAGILFKPDDSTKFAVAYRSEVRHKLTGTLQTAGVSGEGSGVAIVNAANLQGNGAAAGQITLPDMITFSLSKKINSKNQFLIDISRTGWSSVQQVDIVNTTIGQTIQQLQTKYRDSWRLAIGLNHAYSSNLTLKAGYAYDQGAVRSASTRLVSLPDNDRQWLSLGAQYKYSKHQVVDFGLARVFIKSASINNDSTSATLPYPNIVNGNYKSGAWLMGLQYSHAF